jgi:hypothetical protein
LLERLNLLAIANRPADQLIVGRELEQEADALDKVADRVGLSAARQVAAQLGKVLGPQVRTPDAALNRSGSRPVISLY